MRKGVATFQELVRELAKREGKKAGVNIAQLSEVTARLLEILGGVSLVQVACLIAGALARKAKRRAR